MPKVTVLIAKGKRDLDKKNWQSAIDIFAKCFKLIRIIPLHCLS